MQPVLIFLSTAVVLLIEYHKLSSYDLEVILVLLICIGVACGSFISLSLFRSLRKKGIKVLQFIATLLIQLFVYTTGGIYSPFLILIHFYTLGLSLFYRFSLALIFLASSILILTAEFFVDPSFHLNASTDPGTLLLYGVTFLTILPLGYILSSRYHGRDTLLRLLNNEIALEESILSGISDLVFVLNASLEILSVNDAVERTLHISRVALLHRQILDVIYIYKGDGTLLTKDVLFSEMKQHKVMSSLILYTTDGSHFHITLHIRPILSLENNEEQISIILSMNSKENEIPSQSLDHIQVRYDAIYERIKKILFEKGMSDLAGELLLMGKIEQDIRNLNQLMFTDFVEKKVIVDLAKLCNQLVKQKREFANLFHKTLTFSLLHFDEEEVKKLGNVTGNPKEFTGPFFSTLCDIKHISILLQKLLDLAILLSGENGNVVHTTIDRKEGWDVISIVTSSSVPSHIQKYLFTISYGLFGDFAKLSLGSGLEGYISHSIANQLSIPLQVQVNEKEKYIMFTIQIPKNANPLTK